MDLFREQWLLKDGRMEPKPDALPGSSVSDRTVPEAGSSSSHIPFYPLMPQPQPPSNAVLTTNTETGEMLRKRQAMHAKNRKEALERQESKRRRRISSYSALAEQRRLMEAQWKSSTEIQDSSCLNNDQWSSSPVNTRLELGIGGNSAPPAPSASSAPPAPPLIFQPWCGYPGVQLMGVGNGLGMPYMMPCWVPMGTQPASNLMMPTMIPVNPVGCVPTARQDGTNSPAISTIENEGSACRRVVSSNDLLVKNSSKDSQKMHHGDLVLGVSLGPLSSSEDEDEEEDEEEEEVEEINGSEGS